MEFGINKYQIGDILVFHSMPKKEWLLVEIGEKIYKFVNLWEPDHVWTSHKTAPIHKTEPLKHYQSGESHE